MAQHGVVDGKVLCGREGRFNMRTTNLKKVTYKPCLAKIKKLHGGPQV